MQLFYEQYAHHFMVYAFYVGDNVFAIKCKLYTAVLTKVVQKKRKSVRDNHCRKVVWEILNKF